MDLPDNVINNVLHELMKIVPIKQALAVASVNQWMQSVWLNDVKDRRMWEIVKLHLPQCTVMPAKYKWHEYKYLITLDLNTVDLTNTFVEYFVTQQIDATVIWRAVKPDNMPTDGLVQFLLKLNCKTIVYDYYVASDEEEPDEDAMFHNMLVENLVLTRFYDVIKGDGVDLRTTELELRQNIGVLMYSQWLEVDKYDRMFGL